MSYMYKFRDCLSSEVASQAIINGSFLVCRDTGDMYYDNLEGDRIKLSAVIHVVTGRVNSELYPEEGHFYYSTTDKQVCIYHSGTFQPINITPVIVTLGNLVIPKNSYITPQVNPVANRLNTGYSDVIVSVNGHSLTTDLSIADMDESQFMGNTPKITFGNVTNTSGIYTIRINNANTTYAWLGSAEILVFTSTAYNNANSGISS